MISLKPKKITQEEIISGMKQIKIASTKNIKAMNMLNAAAEMFEAAGCEKKADEVTILMRKIAARIETIELDRMEIKAQAKIAVRKLDRIILAINKMNDGDQLIKNAILTTFAKTYVMKGPDDEIELTQRLNFLDEKIDKIRNNPVKRMLAEMISKARDEIVDGNIERARGIILELNKKIDKISNILNIEIEEDADFAGEEIGENEEMLDIIWDQPETSLVS